MRWGENETCLFVNLYLKNDVLWNTRNTNYKSKFLRQQAYKNIIEGLRSGAGISLSEEEVKMKIKSLRSTYSQELVKIRDRSDSDCRYKPALKWFDEWHRKMNNAKRGINDTTSESNEPDEDLCPNIDNENADTKIDPFASPPGEDYFIIVKSECEQNSEKEHIPHKTKRRKIISYNQSVDASERVHRISLDALKPVKEDEFDIYGKYIATQLRSMDLEKAIKVQLQIQNIVSEARLSKK
ncbi:unnamed protein product [Diatraea saccharalis]|uniref:MADF domain-containing protein n=1 Tax=Diatraea saccharalis TaxID=40085 RepID=A0A9N9WDH7_9NEOP|nr:unnamed protein product [Diatraea saccharalis]